MASNPQVCLVTGAGSGIGRAIAVALARAGHIVYASMRDVRQKNLARAVATPLPRVTTCRCRWPNWTCCPKSAARPPSTRCSPSAAGWMSSSTTRACSWWGVNRAALPAMRRQGGGVLMYVGSTTTRLHEPFLGPYIASKVAGEALAEVLGMEVRPSGIETVMLVPGAFTEGTEHFAGAQGPAYAAIEQQYGELPQRVRTLGPRLDAIDAAHGGSLQVDAVGDTAVEVLRMPRGQRPSCVVIDGQRKGTEAVDEVHHRQQVAFLQQMGLEDLSPPAPCLMKAVATRE